MITPPTMPETLVCVAPEVIGDDLKPYLDNELPFLRRLAVRRHLAACPACREEAVFMAKIGKDFTLAASNKEGALSSAFRARLLDTFNTEAAEAPPVLARPPLWRERPFIVLGSTSLAGFALLIALLPSQFDPSKRETKSGAVDISVRSTPAAPAAKQLALKTQDTSGRKVDNAKIASAPVLREVPLPKPTLRVKPEGVTKSVASSKTLPQATTESVTSAKRAPARAVPPAAKAMPLTAVKEEERSRRGAAPAEPLTALAAPAPSSVVAGSPIEETKRNANATTSDKESRQASNFNYDANNLASGVRGAGSIGGARGGFGGGASAAPDASFEAQINATTSRNASAKDVARNNTLERKVRKEASLGVEVANVEQASEKVEELAKLTSGFVASNNLSTGDNGTRSAVLTVSVPAKDFEATLAKLTKLGKVVSKSVSGEDITEQVSAANSTDTLLAYEIKQAEAKLKASRTEGTEVQREQDLRSVKIQRAQAQSRLELLKKRGESSTIQVQLTEKKPDPPPSGRSPE